MQIQEPEPFQARLGSRVSGDILLITEIDNRFVASGIMECSCAMNSLLEG